MPERGVYTKEVAKMLESWQERANKGGEWVPDESMGATESLCVVNSRVATIDTMVSLAYSVDHKNPLWRDDNYAKNTRWGGIIAHPNYPYFMCEGHVERYINQGVDEYGPTAGLEAGGSWQWYMPIREGDSFRVRIGDNITIEDKTRLDGKGPYLFLITNDVAYINQRNEVVCIRVAGALKPIFPYGTKGEKVSFNTMPQHDVYRYTKEELEYLEHIYFEEEEIRGANPRYWDDVKVGDEVKPVTTGPTRVGIKSYAALAKENLSSFDVKRRWPERYIVDPETNVVHHPLEAHTSDRIAKLEGPNIALNSGADIEVVMMRLLTNWMGDDGFILKLSSQRRQIASYGDTLIGRGKVAKKYEDNGKYLADLEVWVENIRGYICSPGTATVSLPKKGVPFYKIPESIS